MPAFSPFDPLVRILTGHVISSASMASRAYLKDEWRAVIAREPDGELWLAATADALAPDVGDLIRRGEEAGGPPARYARASLVKITVVWGDVPGRPGSGREVEIVNPRVVGSARGDAVAVVSLAKARELVEAIADGRGPKPVDLSKTAELASIEDSATTGSVSVATLFRDEDGGYWPVCRRARMGTEPGVDFLGQRGAMALDFDMQRPDAGSPVFVLGTSAPMVFLGLSRPVAPNVAILLPARLIVEALATT